jgi:hypothetical protein
MKKLLLLLLIVTAGCGGYKNTKSPMSPEEVQIADLAQKLENETDEFQNEAQPPFQEPLAEFAQRASRFHNACRRFGSNSLEARSAFDRVHYQAGQVSNILTKDSAPALYEKWETLRKDLLEIGEILGYRPEKAE